MIREIEKQEFEASSDINLEKSFKIAANAEMFKLLSDNIYSNKIGAVIRETACNAFDAHVDAGLDTPFEVYLPCIENPEFKIRDFGFGLDEYGMDIFTTYGDSTKTRSNASIGAFGIGAKSPFAYTNTFSVVSICKGIKRSYIMYLAEDGCPKPSKIGEEPTDEPSGLAISFSVEPDDFSRFRSEAEKQLVHMADKINFPEWPSFGTSLRTEASKFSWEKVESYPDGYYAHNLEFQSGYYANLTIVMANVEYDVSGEELLAILPKDLMEEGNLKIQGYLCVPNGTFSPHPSRERLSFSDKTKSEAEKLIRAVYEQFFFSKVRTITDDVDSYVALSEKIDAFSNTVHKDITNKLSFIKSFKLPSMTLTYGEWTSKSIFPVITASYSSQRYIFTKASPFTVRSSLLDGDHTLFIRDCQTNSAVTDIKMSDRRKAMYAARQKNCQTIVCMTSMAFRGSIFTPDDYDAFPSFDDLVSPTVTEFNTLFGIVPGRKVAGIGQNDDIPGLKVDYMDVGLDDTGAFLVGGIFRTVLKDLDTSIPIVVAPRHFSSFTCFSTEYNFTAKGEFSSAIATLLKRDAWKFLYEKSYKVRFVFMNPKTIHLLTKHKKAFTPIETFCTDFYTALRNKLDLSFTSNRCLEDPDNYLVRSLVAFIKKSKELCDVMLQYPLINFVMTTSGEEQSGYLELYKYLERRSLAIPGAAFMVGYTKPVIVTEDDVVNDFSSRFPLFSAESNRYHLSSLLSDLDPAEFLIYVKAREAQNNVKPVVVRPAEKEETLSA